MVEAFFKCSFFCFIYILFYTHNRRLRGAFILSRRKFQRPHKINVLTSNSELIHACPSVRLQNICCEDFTKKRYRLQVLQKDWKFSHSGWNWKWAKSVEVHATAPSKLITPRFFKSNKKLFLCISHKLS